LIVFTFIFIKSAASPSKTFAYFLDLLLYYNYLRYLYVRRSTNEQSMTITAIILAQLIAVIELRCSSRNTKRDLQVRNNFEYNFSTHFYTKQTIIIMFGMYVMIKCNYFLIFMKLKFEHNSSLASIKRFHSSLKLFQNRDKKYNRRK